MGIHIPRTPRRSAGSRPRHNTGGVLPLEKFERFLEALGFEAPQAALPKAA